jgi:hypoxanthine phosphoribosyltransferase
MRRGARRRAPLPAVAKGAQVPTFGDNLHDDIEKTLISESVLQARIDALARAIEADYAGKEVLLVGILRGAIMFMADLARRLNLPVEMDFMAISSYGNATESSGVVRIVKDLNESIEGRHVLIVEDIIDSGLTLKYLMENLQGRHPASVAACLLLDKERDRAKVIEPAYVGFKIPDRFVVGYGLDYAQKYRNLPYIGVLKPSVYGGS